MERGRDVMPATSGTPLTSTNFEKVKECAFCKCDVDLSRRKNFEYLEDGEICCSICFERESDTGE